MSIKIMSKVWDIESDEVDVTLKMILLAMADFADDDGGGIWPSVATLAKKCSLQERAVQARLKKMKTDGWITIDGRKPIKGGYVNVYRINIAMVEAKGCIKCRGALNAGVHLTTFSGAFNAPNPSEPSVQRETRENEPQHEPSAASLSKRIEFKDSDVPANLRTMKAPPRKRKPFKRGAWKGYDPDPSSRHETVKAYRRAFPFIRLERTEAKALTAYRDTERLVSALEYWRKGVMQKGWSARNWRGIHETYDRLSLRPAASVADVVKPAQTEQYQPVYN